MSVTATPEVIQPPPPLEWHPAYRDQTWLFDWLNGDTRYSPDRIILPVGARRRLLSGSDALQSEDLQLRERVLIKQKACGLAPYVGRPFVYVWHVATDELGRSIAGESRIVYTPDFQF